MAILDDAIEAYAADHTTPVGDLFHRLRDETREKTTAPGMQVGPVEGTFLRLLVQLTGARRILEIGMFTGYSALMMGSALPDDGRLVTCDVDAEVAQIARRYFDESGYGEKIEIRLGPALETLKTLAGPFDLAFVDADKEHYPDYFDAVVPLLRRGGLLVADNVLWSGRVLGDDDAATTRAIRAFNDKVQADDRVEQVMLTVRDGMTLARKR